MEISYTTHVPFHLEAVVKTHGWFQLVPFYWQEESKSLTWAMRDPSGIPVLVHIFQDSFSEKKSILKIKTDMDISKEAQTHIIKKFEHVFHLNLNLDEFYTLCKNNSILKDVPVKGMGRLMRSESVYEDVFKSICGTNIQWKQAVKIINTIGLQGECVAGTEYHVFPGPQQILNLGESFLREQGRAGYRSNYLIALCQRILAENSFDLPQKDLVPYFTNFKGIGKVTARYLAALYGDFSEMAVDSLVIAFMTKHHFNGEKPTERQIEAYYDKFGKWKYLAYWMEFILAGGWSPET